MRRMIRLAFVSLLAVSGCDALVSGAGSTLQGSGVTREQKRQVASFEEVDISETFETTITIGPTLSVTLSVDDNLVNLVKTTVVDGRLSVSYVRGPIIVTSKPQRVLIVVPSLDRIVARGASKVMAGVVEEKSFKVESTGAAAVEISGLDCESVEVVMDGAGRVSIEGKGKSLTIEASGASRLRASGASFKSATVALDGASKCEVNVADSIAGELSGASQLVVQGEPTARSVKASGASRVSY